MTELNAKSSVPIIFDKVADPVDLTGNTTDAPTHRRTDAPTHRRTDQAQRNLSSMPRRCPARIYR